MGCSSSTAPTGDGGGTPDLSGGGADFAGADFAGADFAGGGNTLAIRWDLLTANLMNGTNNGFAINCDDPTLSATMISFLVTNVGNTMITTVGPCPAGASSGMQTLALPDPNGPFVVSATLVGKPMSASQKVQNVTPASSVNLRIYAFGCDAPECQ
jgi:hypothetical protein